MWHLDRVYDQGVTTDVIYEELIAPILEDAMSGINGKLLKSGKYPTRLRIVSADR